MVSKTYWIKPIEEYLKLVNQVKEKQKIKIHDTVFEVFPGVFSPIISSDTAWFAEKIIPRIKNKKFLEIGSGAGIIACLAAMNGAYQVTATDINPEAIKNIRSNAELHSLNISIRKGSVFDPIHIDELYDIIFWNHPFYCGDKSQERDMHTASVYDTEYQSLKKFFQQGKKYLTKEGQLILGTSNIAKINLIKNFAKIEGYEISLLDKMSVTVYKGKKVEMEIRMYSFKIPLKTYGH